MSDTNSIQQYINIVSMQYRNERSAALEKLRKKLLKELSHDDLATAISSLIEQKVIGDEKCDNG